MNPTVQSLLTVLNSTLEDAAKSDPRAKLGLTAAAALASILDNRFGSGSRELVIGKPSDVSDDEWTSLNRHPIMSPTVVDDGFNAALKAERAANPKPPVTPSPSYPGPSHPPTSQPPGPSHPGPSANPGPSHPAPPLPPGPSHPPSPSYPGPSYTPGPSHPGPSRA